MNCPKVLNDVYIYVGSVCSVLKCRICVCYQLQLVYQKWEKVPKVEESAKSAHLMTGGHTACAVCVCMLVCMSCCLYYVCIWYELGWTTCHSPPRSTTPLRHHCTTNSCDYHVHHQYDPNHNDHDHLHNNHLQSSPPPIITIITIIITIITTLLPYQPLFTVYEESARSCGGFGGGRPREGGGVCRASEVGDEEAACRACLDEVNRVLTLFESTFMPPACMLRKVLECQWRLSLLWRCCCSFSCCRADVS